MAKYSVKSKMFTGELRFDFDCETEEIVAFVNQATLNEAQLGFLSQYFPSHLWKLKTYWKKCQLVLIPDRPPTFQEFWDKYNYKKGRLNAEKEFNKLVPEEKAKALRKIAQYQNDCRTRNTPLLYAERYLKNKRFNDE